MADITGNRVDIIVNIVDADGNSTTLTHPSPVDYQTLIGRLATNHGRGDLVRGQNQVVLDETLHGGTFTYKVTGPAAQAGSSVELHNTVVGAVLEALEKHSEGSQPALSFAMSKASSAMLQKVLHRLQFELSRGHPFPRCKALPVVPLTDFRWPRNGEDKEDEVMGYATAVEWVQTHLCPDGVTAVLKHETQWLRSSRAMTEGKIHVRDGATDIVFVLAERAEQVKQAEDISGCLFHFVGQTELKTVTAFKKQTANTLAQSAVEQLSASLLLRDMMVAAGVEPKEYFLTVATDLNERWAVYQFNPNNPGMMRLYEGEPPVVRGTISDLRVCAVTFIKKSLAKAAKVLRALVVDLTKPDSEDDEACDQAPMPAGGQAPMPAGGQAPMQAGGQAPMPGGGQAPVPAGGQAPAPGRGQAPMPAGGQAPTPAGSSHAADGLDTTMGGTAPSGEDLSGRLGALGPPGSQRQVEEVSRTAWNRIMQDDDMKRVMEADYSLALVSLLRTPLGYKGLLERSSPPATVQHPSLFELWEHPLHEHAALIKEAMTQEQADGCTLAEPSSSQS